jgi:hypothetical protein
MSHDLLLQLLADAVLTLHVAVVVFVVGGLFAVFVGNWRGWGWVNGLRFRVVHVALVVLVAVQSWLGVVCPLTDIEMWLRAKIGSPTYRGSFVEYWLQRLLYYEAPPWVFVLVYTLFGALVIAAWLCFPPRSRQREP